MIIFDTDILSVFAKIKRLELIKRLFGMIYITPMIREELTVPLEYGYDFPKEILEKSTVIIPTLEELGQYNEFKRRVETYCRNSEKGLYNGENYPFWFVSRWKCA